MKCGDERYAKMIARILSEKADRPNKTAEAG